MTADIDDVVEGLTLHSAGTSVGEGLRLSDTTDSPNEVVDFPSCPEDIDPPMRSLLVTNLEVEAESPGVNVSDHVHVPSTAHQQCLEANSPPPYPTQEHIPTTPLKTPPDKLHPTLSSWIKNMNKLSSLIDRLKELARSAPAEHQSQLSER